MDWIQLAQDRDQWQAVMNTVMNLWVSPNSGVFWLADELLTSKEGLGLWIGLVGQMLLQYGVILL